MWYLFLHSDSTSTDKICGYVCVADMSLALICDEIPVVEKKKKKKGWTTGSGDGVESLSISQRYLNPHCVVRLGNVPQASHLQSVQVVAHTNRQLVGGSSSSGADEPSYLHEISFLPFFNSQPPSFTTSHSLVSPSLPLQWLSPPLPPPLPPSNATNPTHTCCSPPAPSPLLSFSLLHCTCTWWTLWRKASSHWALPVPVHFTLVWYGGSCQAWL